MRPIDLKPNTYIDSGKKNYEKDPKFKIGGNVRISKHKKFFSKGYILNRSEEVFVIKKEIKWKSCDNSFNSWIDKKDR